jgi:DNA-binding transcriptional LysR family regulator
LIELRQFRQFIAIAEELSFRRAAERLNMAQPPLTATIKRLEDTIGTRLIERTNRVTRLTEAGRVFLEEARKAVEQADRAILAARRVGAGVTGTLRVTFIPSAARDILPAILLPLRDRYPGIKLELHEAMTTRQIELLAAGESDLGFVIPPLPHDADLTVQTIARHRLVAALPDGHPLASQAEIALSDLAEDPWVLYSARQGPGLHRIISAACAEAGFTPHIGQQATQMDTIINLVAGGMGVALVSAALAGGPRKGVVFCELRGQGTPVEYEIAIAYRERSAVIDTFVAAVRMISTNREASAPVSVLAPG